MRIVLDTNVLVSALLSREGPPGRVLAVARRQRHTLITSTFQIDEFRVAISRKHLRAKILPEEAETLVYDLEAVAHMVTELPEVNLSPDPDDNFILATAIAGGADLIVSGDKKHVLNLKEIDGIPIVSPREALE